MRLGAVALACSLGLSACIISRSVGSAADEGSSGSSSGPDTTTSVTNVTSDPTLSSSSMTNTTDRPSTSTSPTGDESGTTRGSADSGPAGSTTTGIEGSTGVDPVCPYSGPGFNCQQPTNCLDSGCGGLHDLFDADGCPYPSCADGSACLPGSVCFRPHVWGFCTPSQVSCSETGESCQCLMSTDCDGEYCLPEEIAPARSCPTWDDDPAECLAEGCTIHIEASRIAGSEQPCPCSFPEGLCLWFPDGISGSLDAPSSYFRMVNNQPRVYVFPETFNETPLGWERCSQAALAPPACNCFQDFEGCGA